MFKEFRIVDIVADCFKENISKHIFYGFCNVCKERKIFVLNRNEKFPEDLNFRENLICTGCKLNTRQRLTFFYVENIFHQSSKDKRCLLAEAVTPFAKLLKAKFGEKIVTFEFFGLDLKPSTLVNGILHEDLCNLSFPDNYFDIVIAQDVFEHVYDYKKAFYECYRVLKNGGMLIFTIPFNPNLEKSIMRAYIDNFGNIVNLYEPIYHGDPVNSSGALVFTDFGLDLFEELKLFGFEVTAKYNFDLKYLIIHYIPSLVWLCRKV